MGDTFDTGHWPFLSINFLLLNDVHLHCVSKMTQMLRTITSSTHQPILVILAEMLLREHAFFLLSFFSAGRCYHLR